MPTMHQMATGETQASLEDYFRTGLISKKTYDKLFDKQLEAKVLERIKSANESQFITHEELKARLGIES